LLFLPKSSASFRVVFPVPATLFCLSPSPWRPVPFSFLPSSCLSLLSETRTESFPASLLPFAVFSCQLSILPIFLPLLFPLLFLYEGPQTPWEHPVQPSHLSSTGSTSAPPIGLAYNSSC